MASDFASALVEFAATTAALNARALHRAGLLEEFERGVMSSFLDFVEGHAELSGDATQMSVARSLRELLPPEHEDVS